MMFLSLAAAFAADSQVIVGSYGRVQASTDLAGGQGDPTSFVAHGTRLELDPYLELDLGWQVTPQFKEDVFRPTFRVLVTPALSGPLFHYDGTFDADLGIRNLYVQAEDLGVPGVGVWAGSRMYRGDDVYLLDFWPLDSLNTVGGGAFYMTENTWVGLHVGLNRLGTGDWQFQEDAQPLPGGVGEEWVTVLDRQRTVYSLKASHTFKLGKIGLRPKVYGELHSLPSGTREVEDGVDQALPADNGYLLGGEVSAFGWARDSYAHVFYKHAQGLAAVGELTVPTDGLAVDRTVTAASEDLVALAANHEGGVWGVAAGAYWRAWQDADGEDVDFDDGNEWILAVRPAVYPAPWLSIALEGSHQWVYRESVHPRTQAQGTPQITKLSLIPAVQPGRGTFARPQVRFQYTMSLLNDDALSWYAEEDTRSTRAVQHFVGIGAEWWINSQSYK
jgi:maltoporin